MKLFKRLLLVLCLVLLGVVVAAALGYFLLRGRPGFYRTYAWDGQQRSVVNQRAVEKLTLAQNLAARAQAGEQRAATAPAAVPSTHTAVEPLTVTFTEEELNAFLMHNVEASPDFKQKYEQYVKDPGVFLGDGQIILAGEVKDVGAVVSLHFAPKIDQQGRLHMPLVRSLGGRLPLPTAFMSQYVDRIRNALLSRLPQWQREASIDRTGRSNTSAVAAAMTKLLLGALNDRPSDAVLFMPIADGSRSVPLRLTDVQVKAEGITLCVQAMTAAERQMVLDSIRRPVDGAGQNSSAVR
jgi:uncharacterized protein YpmS